MSLVSEDKEAGAEEDTPNEEESNVNEEEQVGLVHEEIADNQESTDETKQAAVIAVEEDDGRSDSQMGTSEVQTASKEEESK